MKSKLWIVMLLGASFLMLVGCGSMSPLKNFDDNMPDDLVDQYRAGSGYLSDDHFWFPFLMYSHTEVFRTKEGFSADRGYTLGPLGFLAFGFQDASFDEWGRVNFCGGVENYFWGVATKSYGSVNTADGWKYRNSFGILFGMFGYGERLDGKTVLYLFFLPIPVG